MEQQGADLDRGDFLPAAESSVLEEAHGFWFEKHVDARQNGHPQAAAHRLDDDEFAVDKQPPVGVMFACGDHDDLGLSVPVNESRAVPDTESQIKVADYTVQDTGGVLNSDVLAGIRPFLRAPHSPFEGNAA